MTFADIPSGSSVFVDADTFVYHFTPHPVFRSACEQLMDRFVHKDVLGFTSAEVLRDVAHRLMTMEAIIQFGWPVAGIAQRLRHRHDEIPKLGRFRQAIDEIPRLGVQVMPATQQLVSAAAALSQSYELLSGDALIVAHMQANGLAQIASQDRDFDRVSGLTRSSPV
jgi:predicted nucleic acid-binding protein